MAQGPDQSLILSLKLNKSTQKTVMTQISLTSGEIMDIVSILCDKEQAVYDKDPLLSAYYLRMVQQFEDVYHKLQEFPGEKELQTLFWRPEL